jgi:hypothetical protein
VSTASLKADIRRLRERRPSFAAIPDSAIELARAGGMEDLDPWQEDALRSEASRILFNVARQGGKSSTAGLLSADMALRVPGSLTLILAPAERQAKETFAKAARFYLATGRVVPPDSYRKLGMELTNGSRIEALPGTEKTIRGFSGAALLIVDEAARVEDGLYYAIRPMLATSGGRLALLSTPHGKRGVFFEEWENGGEGWERYEIPASECERIPASFLEEERRSLPAFIYQQEYCAEFVDTEDQLFGYDLVSSSITDEVTPLFGEAS